MYIWTLDYADVALLADVVIFVNVELVKLKTQLFALITAIPP